MDHKATRHMIWPLASHIQAPEESSQAKPRHCIPKIFLLGELAVDVHDGAQALQGTANCRAINEQDMARAEAVVLGVV